MHAALLHVLASAAWQPGGGVNDFERVWRSKPGDY
jgi:hypothetical protein